MLQAILFDFNGVIIDDEALQLNAYREVLRAHDIELTDEDYYGALGQNDATFTRAAFARAGKELTDETLRTIIERKSELHREMIKDELPLFPGVVTFAKALARRYTLGVVSMARLAEIEDTLNRAGLKDSFTVIVSGDEAKACKPDPWCCQTALEQLNAKRRAATEPPIAPQEVLVIEDSPPGIEAARAARMRTLGVTNTVAEERLRAAGAEVVTRSLADWTPDAVHHLFDERRPATG